VKPDGAVMMVLESLLAFVDEVNDQPVGKPQEKVLMNIAASFLSVKNQGMSIRRRADNTTEGDADWLNNTPTRVSFNDTC
jgi:hypothetical protein